MDDWGRLGKPFAFIRRYIAVITLRFIDTQHGCGFTDNDATMQQFVALAGEFIDTDFLIHIDILAELFSFVKPLIARV